MLGQLFPEPPLVTFRRCPTIRDKLVRSYLKPEGQQTWLGSKPKGSYKCQHCNHCTNVLQSKTFVDTVSLKQFTINHFISCKTVFVIYRLECPECKVFYIGRTKRRLQDRLAEHKYAIRTGNMNYCDGKFYFNHYGLMILTICLKIVLNLHKMLFLPLRLLKTREGQLQS